MIAVLVAALATLAAIAPGIAPGAAAGKAAPSGLPAEPPAPRAALLAAIAQAQGDVAGFQKGGFDQYQRPEYKQALARLWTLVERWTVEFLAAHPEADGRAIAADLAKLAAKIEFFDPTAVRLESAPGTAAAVSVEAGWSGGTFFVASSAQTDRSAAAWSIRPLAEKNFPLGNELGAWAFTVPGYHDGPLGGGVLALPAARSGRPRFLIDAYTHPAMGQERPGQISVWAWTGSQAELVFIKDYQLTYEIHKVERQGDLVRIATKEEPKVFFTCGSCDEPRGSWTLRVTPDGVLDLGHAWEDPLLQAADELLARVARHEDASALAAPEVIAKLKDLVRRRQGEREEERHAHGRQQESEADDPYAGLLSDLQSCRVKTTSGGHRIFDLATSDWRVILTFDRRGGADFVTAVTIP